MTLQPAQKKQLDDWIEEVREHEHWAFKWASLLYKIKQSDYWRSSAENWPEFCYQTFGYSKAKAYRYVACGEALAENEEEFKKDPPKSMRAVTARVKVARVQHSNLEYVGTENDKPMSARLVPRGEIEHVTPEPLPVQVAVTTAQTCISVSPIVVHRIDEIVREGFRLNYHDPKFLHFLDNLLKLQKMVQAELPGMAEHFPAKNKGKGTLQEVADFCFTLGLQKSDGEWFYYKCEGCGWKNNGKPILSWQDTCRAWEKQRIFPSQKQTVGNTRNGAPAEKHWSTKATDAMLARLKKEEGL